VVAATTQQVQTTVTVSHARTSHQAGRVQMLKDIVLTMSVTCAETLE